jgi:hypothetical protein
LVAIFERYFNAGFSNQAQAHNLEDADRVCHILESIDEETRK